MDHGQSRTQEMLHFQKASQIQSFLPSTSAVPQSKLSSLRSMEIRWLPKAQSSNLLTLTLKSLNSPSPANLSKRISFHSLPTNNTPHVLSIPQASKQPVALNHSSTWEALLPDLGLAGPVSFRLQCVSPTTKIVPSSSLSHHLLSFFAKHTSLADIFPTD